MSHRDENMDELLSGYLDGQLSSSERLVVEDALSRDSQLQRQLDELRSVRAALKGLAETRDTSSPGLSARWLPNDFAAAVVAEAQRRAVELDFPPSHHVRRGVREVKLPALRRQRTVMAVLSTVAALAAVWLLSIYIPVWFLSDDGQPKQLASGGGVSSDGQDADGLRNPLDRDMSADADSLPAENVQYVGEVLKITYTLVLDMQLGDQARADGYIDTVLKQSGIRVEDPIVVDEKIQGALSEARLTVLPENDDIDDALVYFVHADTLRVGGLMQVLYDDLQNVPQLRFDLAFNTPAASLMQQMAEGSGRRFAMDAAIAAPLAVDSGVRKSPFAGIPEQGLLVSSSSRKGPGQADGPNVGLEGEETGTILLLVRIPK